MINAILSATRHGYRNLLRHRELPGYRQLDWAERQRVNLQALWLFATSAEGLRWALCLIGWLLLAGLAIDYFALRGHAAFLAAASALVWAMPWLAAARRRCIARLLGPHWTDL